MKISNNIEFNPIRQTILVNGEKMSWVRRQNGRDRLCNQLSTKESQLLEFLLQNKNNVVSVENTLQTLWVDVNFNNKRSADVYINFLRNLLGKWIKIETVYGGGWKLTTITTKI